MHTLNKIILTALVLVASVGCDYDWENGGGGPNGGNSPWENQESAGMGFELEIQPHGNVLDLELSCTIRSDVTDGTVPCDGMRINQWSAGVFVVTVPNVAPDARLTLIGTSIGVGDEDRMFCRNDPESDLYPSYNGFALDHRLQSDCEVTIRVDDLKN